MDRDSPHPGKETERDRARPKVRGREFHSPKRPFRTVGLMSGTSLDGVDAAWIETDGERIAAFGPTLTIPYPETLRATLRRLLDRAPTLDPNDPELAEAEQALTRIHAEAVRQLGGTPDLVGFHGQTILHDPANRRTWQIGDAPLLARLTGIAVVHDFRSADVAAGGQGAPLAPVYHAALAADLPMPLAVLNIGGVANVTFIGDDGVLLACDTGPGNGPLDDWIARHTGRRFDQDGALASSGTPDTHVLARLLSHAYFARPAPKSLDRLDFSCALEESGLYALSPADGAATLVAFTAAAVAAAQLPPRRAAGWSPAAAGIIRLSCAPCASVSPPRSMPSKRSAGTVMRWRRSVSAFLPRESQSACRSVSPERPGCLARSVVVGSPGEVLSGPVARAIHGIEGTD